MTDFIIEPIVAALQAGDPLLAERLCREQLQAKPDAVDPLVLLALSLWRQGDHAGALDVYARLARLHPEDVMHWRNYAVALRNAGDLRAAERAYETAVRLTPDDPELLELHGLIQMDLGKFVEARDTLLRAFGKSPDTPAIRIHAAQSCSICRDFRVEELLKPWRTWLPLEEDLQFELAEVLIQQGEALCALEVLEDLLRRAPSHVTVQLSLASVYERVNRLDDAEAMLRTIEASGASADQNVRIAIERQRAQLAARRGDAAGAREALERLGPAGDSDAGYWFALAKVCDKLGDPAAAMRALEKGHASQILELKTAVPHYFEAGAEVLPNERARVAAADYREWPILSAPDVSQSPVFVVGFPRSGTTLLEQMLDAHPRLQSMDERPFFHVLSDRLGRAGINVPRDLHKLGQEECDALRKDYLALACAGITRRRGTQLVDKNPLNMLWLPLIHRLFPKARFILALRDPRDVILSCYMQNFRVTLLAAASRSLEHLARAYVAAMASWLHHVAVFKPDVLTSRHEDLVADPAGQTRRIAAFLGLDQAESMLGFADHARGKGYIRTPSYAQVIEPINTRSVGRWQRYREYLEPALPILQPMLEHWGYAAGAPAATLQR